MFMHSPNSLTVWVSALRKFQPSQNAKKRPKPKIQQPIPSVHV